MSTPGKSRTPRTPEVRQLVTGDNLLGESPVWSVAEQVLYWVDIDGHRVHRTDPSTGADEIRSMPGRPGALGLTTTPGRLLVATEHQVVWLDWSTGAIEPWIDLEPEDAGLRMNDGRTDPAGRFVVGSMWPDTKAGRRDGHLHQIDPDGSHRVLGGGLGTPNGTAFDAERGRIYFTDTPTRLVMVADYDLDTGERHNARPFFDYTLRPGKPDGGCVDASGCYWSASIYAWSLVRITPDGNLDRRVELPVEKPTMPAFGGSDLKTLFVTSIGNAGSKPSAPGRAHFVPGDLMAIDIGIEGRPEPLFGR